MKQITLEARVIERPAGHVCLGQLIFTWSLYGFAMALLWELAGRSGLAPAATWTIALIAGLGLLFAIREA